MSTPFEQIAGLDRLIHEPTRLAILTALSACERADFLFLQRITGLTKVFGIHDSVDDAIAARKAEK